MVGNTLPVPGYLDQPSNCDNTTWQSAGGPGELWGAGLTAADFNANSVGFRVTLTGNTADIDAVELVVYFANSAPTAEANGPYAVSEGGSVGLSSAGSSDPESDPLTLEWDLDDNGTFETAGASPVFSAVGRDWRQQLSLRGHHHVDETTLTSLLGLIDCTSSVFSELVPAFDVTTARDVFAPGGSRFDKAVRQTLAAWLNFAAGAVTWDQPIDLDGDSVPDATVAELFAAAEAILLDPGASKAELELAKDLMEAINLLDQGSPECAG